MNILSLNGEWSCRLPDGRTLSVPVPGCWDALIPEKDIAEAVSYTRSFFRREKGSELSASFGAVSYYCDVHLNGTQVGSHEGLWDAFRLDVTDALRDGENELRLEITKPGYSDSGPFFPCGRCSPALFRRAVYLWRHLGRRRFRRSARLLCHRPPRKGKLRRRGEITVALDLKRPGEMALFGLAFMRRTARLAGAEPQPRAGGRRAEAFPSDSVWTIRSAGSSTRPPSTAMS